MLTRIRSYRIPIGLGRHRSFLHPLHLIRLHSTKDEGIDFHPNTRKDDSLQSRLVRFIQKETRILADSMRIDQSLEQSTNIDFSSVDPYIRHRLENEVDDYNRLVLLLGCHPLSVAPELLVQLYASLPSVDSQDRRKLLKALAFHNLWGRFWEISVSESTSLSDVEDLVDLVHEELVASNNIRFGVWQALYSALLQSSNLSLLNSIFEHMEYKFGLEKGAASLFCEYAASLDNVQHPTQLAGFYGSNKDDLHNTDIQYAFYLRKTTEVLSDSDSDKTLVSDHLHTLTTETDFVSSPGWVSFLLSSEKYPTRSFSDLAIFDESQRPHIIRQIGDIFLHNRQVSLNERDYLVLLQTITPQHAYPFYLSLCKNVKRGLIKSEGVFNYSLALSMASNNLDLNKVIVKRFFKHVNRQSWKKLMVQFLSDDEGFSLVKKLHKAEPERFQQLAKASMETEGLATTVTIRILTLSKLEPKCFRQLLRKVRSNHSEVLKGLLNTNCSPYILLELWRYCIRQHLSEGDMNMVFERLMFATWDIEDFKRKGQSFNFQSSDDFRFYYGVASRKEKQALLFNLLAVAQTISTTELDVNAQVLNALHLFINSTKFTFVTSETGRSYIFDRLVARTMHFIYKLKAGDPKKGVMTIRHILTKLNFNSLPTQASLFEYIVYDEPHIALDILTNYSQNKSFLVSPLMDAIVRGILRTSKLDGNQKLSLFQEFCSSMDTLGYKGKLSARSAILLGNLVFRTARTADREELKWMVDLAYERGAPVSVVKNWTKRIT